ncbi:hypothetical protein ANN_21456 [Periplaneta americana]|uniref:Uncharacterized protein n=1 Tax=Periplaneta americana TaxID=6978 RepID=A0ABQ8SGL0_PERAM|nr:hypothetical protein ANN_21456 [Periplaneta americana]
MLYLYKSTTVRLLNHSQNRSGKHNKPQAGVQAFRSLLRTKEKKVMKPPVPPANVSPAMNVISNPSPSQRSEGNNGQSNQPCQQHASGGGTPTNRRQKSWDLLDQTAIAQARQQKQHPQQQTQHQTPLHSVCVTKWCAISAKGVLGLYFVENDGGYPLTVNQNHLRNLIITPFLRDLRRLCCARNIAHHTARNLLNFLKEHFGERIIYHGTTFPYPPDITPFNAYVWGMLKKSIFRQSPLTTIVKLRGKIIELFRHLQ